MGTSLSDPSAVRLSRIAAGYVAGCGIAAIALILHMLVRDPSVLATGVGDVVIGLITLIGMLFLVIFLVGLPGFVLMRLVLHRLKRSDMPILAVAGGILGLLYTLLFFGPQTSSIGLFWEYPPSPIFVAMGALAGAASGTTEAYFARQHARKAGGE
jgi:hypothetical protein